MVAYDPGNSRSFQNVFQLKLSLVSLHNHYININMYLGGKGHKKQYRACLF